MCDQHLKKPNGGAGQAPGGRAFHQVHTTSEKPCLKLPPAKTSKGGEVQKAGVTRQSLTGKLDIMEGCSPPKFRSDNRKFIPL